MPTITRAEVQSALANKELSVSELRASTSVPTQVGARMATADTNGDGVIKGTAEVDKLFDAADHFDSNGNRNSVTATSSVAGLQAAMGLARTPPTTPTPTTSTVTRSDVQASLAGKQVSVAALRASGLPMDVKNRLSGADTNGDGVIKGAAELHSLFDAADYFDNDGNRNSVTAVKSATGLTTAMSLGTPQATPNTMTRSEVQTALTGREIVVTQLNATSALSTQVRAKLATADLNGDGVIRGTAEVDKLFNNADFFDNNGNRDSVAGTANGAPTVASKALLTAINISRTRAVVPVALDDNFRRARAVDAAALRTLLPTEAKHLATAFVSSGGTHAVDPLLLASISKHETANWTSNAFRNKNNAMGLSDGNGPLTLASHAAGIERIAALLGSTTSGPYRATQTYRDLWAVYAPGPATGQPRQSNDPNNLNANWGPAIMAGINSYTAALA